VTRAVVFTAAALADIDEPADWYEARQPGLGEAFLVEPDRLVQRLHENPGQCPEVESGVRRGMVRRFPSGVVFRDMTGTVQVLACFHASRDPRRWQRRV
jgi:plasmid stabilization system protein ParE